MSKTTKRQTSTIKFHSYTAYSIACFAVWAIIFTIGFTFNLHRDGTPVLYIFAGWCIGWFGGAIARKVYKD